MKDSQSKGMGLTRVMQKRQLRFLWLGLGFLLLGVAAKISWELHEDMGLNSLDRRVLLSIAQLRSTTLTQVAMDLTALGSVPVIALFSGIGALVLGLNRNWIASAYLALGNASAGVLVFLLKKFFSRERPPLSLRLIEVSGFSYPSGHSLGSTAFYLFAAFLVWRGSWSYGARVAIIAGVCLVLFCIGFTRLYLAVHYPSDVLSGMLIGAAWGCLWTAVFWPRFPSPRGLTTSLAQTH